ncbi:hypothetical protein LXL04_022578 [Taraxacum kok-saghyz]
MEKTTKTWLTKTIIPLKFYRVHGCLRHQVSSKLLDNQRLYVFTWRYFRFHHFTSPIIVICRVSGEIVNVAVVVDQVR